jgi:heme oxygenase
MTTWVLARIGRATREQAIIADAVRMSVDGLPTNRAEYIDCLTRIYGFEVPIESAFAMTAGLAETVDLRSRRRARLLKADLCSLGVAHPGELGVLRAPPRCLSIREALGWMYVVDRSALLHGVLQRHVAQLSSELAKATSYLTNGGRGAGPRLVDLGIALDEVVQTPEMADQVIAAALVAFAEERDWFATRGGTAARELHGE